MDLPWVINSKLLDKEIETSFNYTIVIVIL